MIDPFVASWNLKIVYNVNMVALIGKGYDRITKQRPRDGNELHLNTTAAPKESCKIKPVKKESYYSIEKRNMNHTQKYRILATDRYINRSFAYTIHKLPKEAQVFLLWVKKTGVSRSSICIIKFTRRKQ